MEIKSLYTNNLMRICEIGSFSVKFDLRSVLGIPANRIWPKGEEMRQFDRA